MIEQEIYESIPDGRCKPCKYGNVVFTNGGWHFLGCYHKPYHGKWVAEIKDCPLSGEGRYVKK